MKKIAVLSILALVALGLFVSCDAAAVERVFEYNIVYRDMNDEDFSGTLEPDSPVKHSFGTETVLKEPTKIDYNFMGWFTDKECEGDALASLGATDYTSDIVLYAKWEPAGCLAAGTMITMADGTRQAVETLEMGDMIKTFDHETGEISSAPICALWVIEECHGNFTLHFADDITISVVQEHCFFDRDTNRYEIISYQNALEYVGHCFYNADEGKWKELLSIEFSEEPVTAYYIFTSRHYNHVAEGMLSLDPLDEGCMTYVFDFGDNLKFDEAWMLADINRYGLMTLDEMPGVPEEYFNALNMKYLKIAYGKGFTDPQTIEKLIRYYLSQY